MSVNQLIAGGIRLPQFESPMNMMAQLSQLESAREANELRRMQMAQMQRQQEQENALAGMSYADLSASPEQALRHGAPGRQMYGELLKGARERRQAEQAQRESELKALGPLRFALADVSDQSSYDRWRRLVGQLAPSLRDAIKPEYDPKVVKQYSVEADKRLEAFSPKPTQMRLGDRVVTIDTNPNSPTFNEEIRTETMGAEPLPLDVAALRRAQKAEADAKTAVEQARLAGTLPRGEGQRLAPNIQIIADVDGKPIMIDTTQFAGDARLGGVGVIGRPADMRTPAPTTAVIQDPSQPGRQLIVNTREYTGGSFESPGVIGIAGAQAVVARGETAKDRARVDLGSSLDTLESLYDTLNKLKGLPSTERSTPRNIASYIASTTPGQIVGQAVGTDEQSIRDQITASRFILVQQIKNASGMSAQQMNSNFELQNALNSLSDPKVGIEAARKIIANLRKQYVLGAEPTGRGSAGGEQTALPMPSKKEDAVAGQVYQTSRGPARWDGQQFIPVSE